MLQHLPYVLDQVDPHRLAHALGNVVQALLVAVLLILTLLLAYETWSVSMLDDNPSPRFWPITYFVRCASRLETFATLPVATAICAFFGKWLWYRPGGAEA